MIMITFYNNNDSNDDNNDEKNMTVYSNNLIKVHIILKLVDN